MDGHEIEKAIDEFYEGLNPNVTHPAHYTSGNIETWDFIIDQGLGFCLGNAVKYIVRAGKKDRKKYVEDLQKAIAYLNREIKRINEGQ